MCEYINQAVEFNDVISVTTKNGNAIIINEDDYNGLMETLYLSSNKELREKLIKGIETPIDECLSEDEVEW